VTQPLCGWHLLPRFPGLRAQRATLGQIEYLTTPVRVASVHRSHTSESRDATALRLASFATFPRVARCARYPGTNRVPYSTRYELRRFIDHTSESRDATALRLASFATFPRVASAASYPGTHRVPYSTRYELRRFIDHTSESRDATALRLASFATFRRVASAASHPGLQDITALR
jgi:N-acyl-L-homoserine lactone synthetase